jgi:hypothetical protein
MANKLYDLGREKFLNGEIDWTDDDIKLLLVDTADYTVNLGTDEFHATIPSAAIVATSSNFASKTTTLGVADAADVILSTVSGDVSEAVVIYKDSGVSATSPLIAYIDSATGLPVTPNGSDITIEWADTSDKIFKL